MTKYGYQFHTYPVYAEEFTFEGAFKRFSPMPGPAEVYNYALMGLPKKFPLTNEPITVDLVKPFLESAIVEIERDLGCSISQYDGQHSQDYVDGMFTENFSGINLERWPATEIIVMRYKFPHTNTETPYQYYTIPPNWIYLSRNKINVVAAMGSTTVSVNNNAVVTAGGLFTFITGFNRGSWQPGMIEVLYKSGFNHDNLPSDFADLVKTVAAFRFLIDIIPVLIPTNSVSNSIDGVSQSVSYNLPQMFQSKLQAMEAKIKKLGRGITKDYGKTIKIAVLGS